MTMVEEERRMGNAGGGHRRMGAQHDERYRLARCRQMDSHHQAAFRIVRANGAADPVDVEHEGATL